MFNTAFMQLIGIEKGYVDNPNDRGGPTNFGITEAVARENGYIGDMRDMPIEFAKRVYLEKYWDALKLDSISQFSYLVAYELFDTGVNMGIFYAAVFLQKAINAFTGNKAVGVDGIIGPITIKAIWSKQINRDILLVMLNAQQCVRYMELVEKNQKNSEFIKGWISQRVSPLC